MVAVEHVWWQCWGDSTTTEAQKMACTGALTLHKRLLPVRGGLQVTGGVVALMKEVLCSTVATTDIGKREE